MCVHIRNLGYVEGSWPWRMHHDLDIYIYSSYIEVVVNIVV